VTRALAVLVVAGAALAAAGRPAAAFPDLPIRGDVTRCTYCHVSPAGGGLLNDYGRMEAADTLSRGGDGGFLHGLWTPPDWLLLGGDLRAAALAYDDVQATDSLSLAAFPMEADLRAAVHVGSITVAATGGLRGSARLYAKAGASDYVVSSEHYVMWRKSQVGLYVRAGRFFPVQGLRLPDHTLYVRRYTGGNLYEEPYALGVGYVKDLWEVHAAGFVHDPLLDVGRRDAGGVLHVALHGETWGVAASGRLGTGGDGTRILGGLSGRVKGPSGLVFLGEADLIHDTVAGDGAVNKLVGLAGADEKLAQGVQLFGWYEIYQEELGLSAATHHGVGLSLRYMPRAHWEVIAELLGQRIGADDTTGLGMLQLHYYL